MFSVPTDPDALLAPGAMIAPAASVAVPLIVPAPANVTPPAAIVTSPPSDPFTVNVPALMLVVPLKGFVLARTTVFEPALVNVALVLPLIEPLIVKVAPPVAFNVPPVLLTVILPDRMFCSAAIGSANGAESAAIQHNVFVQCGA